MKRQKINIRDFPAPVKERLYRAAMKEDRSMSAIVRDAVLDYLYRNGYMD
jgi:predicted transcriptional regulator